MSEKVSVFSVRADKKPQGLLKSLEKTRSVRSEVPIDELGRNLQTFVNSLDDIIPEDKATKGFELREFTVKVGIDAEGKVGFLGTGASLAASASLTLKFQKATRSRQ